MVERRCAHPRPGLRDCASRHRAAIGDRQGQVERLHDPLDRFIAQQPHADAQPNHLRCGYPAPTNRRCAGGQKRLLDPSGRQVLAKTRQFVRHERLRDLRQFFVELHGDPLGEIAAS